MCKTNCKHGWLYDRTATDCTTYGCPNNSDKTIAGYWTSSACASTHAWYVGYKGQVSSARGAHESGYNGVRPVIEVEKSKLK